MGNALRFLYAHCCKPTSTSGDSESLGPHGVSASTVGVSALAQDLLHFEINSQVPEGLSKHVVSSKKAQANWYRKLLEAWREAKPPPKTPEEASRLIIQTLKRHHKADVEVDAKAVADGDTITVYVSTADARESSCVPKQVHMAVVERSKARAGRNYEKADALHQKIINSGYRVIHIQNEEILARKYRIRLRGIDAPESKMPYGKEAQEELVKLVGGKCLRIFVYDEDRYDRSVGDIYCDGIFVQEVMLKKGLAWHYTAYDQRWELAQWEKEARANHVGLWASKNPEEPWEWRKARREGR